MLSHINFHGIGKPGDTIEQDEAIYWVDEGRFRDIVARSLRSERAAKVRFSFDDGNLSDLLYGAPVMRDHGRHAIFFVLTGRIGQPGYLDEEGIRAISDMGMEIGLHGENHVCWRDADDVTLDRELVHARERLSDAAGAAITRAAMPFGAYNKRLLKRLSADGFEEVFTTDSGPAREGAWLQSRSCIQSDTSDRYLDDIVAGHLPMKWKLRRAASMAARRWLI